MSKRDFIALTMTLCTWGVLSDRVDAVPVVLDFESPESVSAPPANLLSVSLPTPFSYALFEITTEQEGFDDLTFNPVGEDVPEPGSLGSLLLGMAATLFLGRETRRRRQ